MKVAPAVAEVLGVVDDAAGRTEGYGEVLSVAHAPATAPAAPRPAEMERGPAAADEVQPGAGGARGSIEFLGRWNEKYQYRDNERAMPIKMQVEEYNVRRAFSKFVDELVQNGAPSGTFVMTSSTSAFSILRRGGPWRYVSWSASPEDKSYQRHGFVGMAPQGIIDSRLVLVRQGSPNVLRFDHWQALQAGGAAPLTCHASNPGNGGIGMYPEERRFGEWRYTESKCVAARDACSVQLVQGKFLKRVDADLVLEAGNREGTRVNWVGGESDEETYTADTWARGREWKVNEDGSISLVKDPDLVLGVDSGVESDQHKNIRFADFEGVVDDFGASLQMAVYRVTLPRGGFRGKWAGRPPPLAPEDLHTGPRSDGLLSTDEISGKYSAACSCTPAPTICPSMTVVPLGADAIETFRSGCTTVIPILVTCPLVEGGVQIRVPGTNKFRHWQERRFAGDEEGVTFSANGMAKQGCCCFKKRPHSQKRTFQKVDAGDLAGTWCGCFPIVPLGLLAPILCTTKKALNQDQYEVSGCCCLLGLPLPYLCGGTHTREYVNGHPTNVFTLDDDGSDQARNPQEDRWYRDSGCAYGTLAPSPDSDAAFPYCATKCC